MRQNISRGRPWAAQVGHVVQVPGTTSGVHGEVLGAGDPTEQTRIGKIDPAAGLVQLAALMDLQPLARTRAEAISLE